MADLTRVVTRPLAPSALVDSLGGDAERTVTDPLGLSDSVSRSLSGQTEYGAGAPNAALAVPSGAVAANPGNLASLISANSGGTNFALAAGTYTGTFPNKSGNGYYGLPSNHQAVLFDGQTTYPDLNQGTKPSSGAAEAFVGESNNVFANITFERYRGQNDRDGGGTIRTTGKSGMLFRNCEFRHNPQTGLEINGSNHEVRYVTAWGCGRYGWHGNGSNSDFWNCEVFACGDENLAALGQVPRADGGSKGISKFVHSNGIRHHFCYYHGLKGNGKGLWWDINNQNAMVEDSLFEDIDRHGIILELMHGTSIIRRNTLIGTAKNDIANFAHQYAGIHAATCGVAEIYENQVFGDGGYSTIGNAGINLYQNNRDTAGDNQVPEFWSALCGSAVYDNVVEGPFVKYWIGTHVTYTKDGCNFAFNNDPGAVTIENNTHLGSGVTFWGNSEKTPAEWAAVGYS